MAYSNWGAFVFRDGLRRTDHEDVAVFDDQESAYPSGERIFRNLLRTGGHGQWYQHSHHAVLGDGAIRLCGYKVNPELWHAVRDDDIRGIDLDPYVMSRDSDGDAVEWEGDLEGHHFHARMYVDPDAHAIRLGLLFIDPDGIRWTGVSGMEYGAGWMDRNTREMTSAKDWWVKPLGKDFGRGAAR